MGGDILTENTSNIPKFIRPICLTVQTLKICRTSGPDVMSSRALDESNAKLNHTPIPQLMHIVVPGDNNVTQKLCQWDCTNVSTNAEFSNQHVDKLNSALLENWVSENHIMRGLGVLLVFCTDQDCIKMHHCVLVRCALLEFATCLFIIILMGNFAHCKN